jgi:replicative superfamily II helicase
MDEKTKRLTASEILDLPERERDEHVKQMLRERIAYHEAKLKEEREARGEDTSNDRSFLSLSSEEQGEVVQRMLRDRIAYHDAKLAQERAARGEDAASAGQ